jgi:hypothetical protein
MPAFHLTNLLSLLSQWRGQQYRAFQAKLSKRNRDKTPRSEASETKWYQANAPDYGPWELLRSYVVTEIGITDRALREFLADDFLQRKNPHPYPNDGKRTARIRAGLARLHDGGATNDLLAELWKRYPQVARPLKLPKQADRKTLARKPEKSNTKRPAWQRLVLQRSVDGSDHNARLDDFRIRVKGDAAFKFLYAVQQKKGERVKAASLGKTIGSRPDVVFGSLDERLQRIIDRPGKGGICYAML